MKLISSIFIQRKPEVVWDFLKDPENMQQWNPRVEKVTPSEFEDPGTGYCHEITYRMHANARANSFHAEMKVFEPPQVLEIRLVPQSARQKAPEIMERYGLLAQDGGTLLTQTIRVENSGISVLFRGLIWLVTKFGKPTGKPLLANLRDLLEGR